MPARFSPEDEAMIRAGLAGQPLPGGADPAQVDAIRSQLGLAPAAAGAPPVTWLGQDAVPPLQQLMSGGPSGAAAPPEEAPMAPPPPPAARPAPAPGKAAAEPEGNDYSVDPSFAPYLASHYGGGEPEEGDQTVAEMTGEENPIAPVPGLKTAQETREVSPVKIDALTEQDLGEGQDAQYRAAKEMPGLQDDARRAEQWAAKTGARKAEIVEGEYERKAAEKSEAFKRLLARHEESTKEIGALDIEEPSLWSGNAGADIMRGIGFFLFGLGAGPEALQKQINVELDRDLALQKDRIANKRKSWETEGLLLDRMGAIYDDEATRDLAAKNAALKSIEGQIQRFALAAQNPVERARAEAATGVLQTQIAAQDLEFRTKVSDKVVRTNVMPKPTGGGGDPLKALKLRNEYMKLEGWDPELYVPSAHGYALNGEQHKKMIAAGVAANNLTSALVKLKKLAEDSAAARVPATTARREAQVLIRDAQLAIKESKQLGALDKGSLSVAEDMVPSISILAPNAGAAYDTLIQRTITGHTNQMRESGLRNGPPPPNFRGQDRPAGFQPEGGAPGG